MLCGPGNSASPPHPYIVLAQAALCDDNKQSEPPHDPQVIKYLYENTDERRPLRELILDIWIRWGASQWLKPDKMEKFPRAFFSELAARIMQRGDMSKYAPTARDYHWF